MHNIAYSPVDTPKRAEFPAEAGYWATSSCNTLTTRSKDENDRFFANGMHDDLLTQLARIGDLKVISRASVMESRDTTKNLKKVGTEPGVAAFLECLQCLNVWGQSKNSEVD